MDTRTSPTPRPPSSSARRSAPGSEQPFEEWQKDLNGRPAKYPGFLGAEINPPTAVQPEWVVVYRFDSIAHVRPGSTAPRARSDCDRGSSIFDGPGTQQVLGGGARQSDPLVTVAVSHRVEPEERDEFLAWQDRLRLAESKFPGFRGTELFRPVAGVQEEWTALYRYDSAADLDSWLVSDERQAATGRGREIRRLPVPHHRQLVRQLVRVRRDTARRRRPRRTSRRRSRCGSACTPPSCCSPWRCRR